MSNEERRRRKRSLSPSPSTLLCSPNQSNSSNRPTTSAAPSFTCYTLNLTLLSAIGGFLFGYDTGVVSGAMLLIEDDPRIDPSTIWKELIVSSTVGAAWLFALIAGPVCERWGRKPVILSASVIFAVGAAVMGAAVTKEVLLVGRIIVGAGIGFASMAVPIYISEAAPPDLRGLLVSSNVLVITFGQFVAACVCGGLADVKPDGWKYMLGLGGVPAVVQLVGFSFMPESPRWLVSKGRSQEARERLRRMRGSEEEADREMEEIERTVEEEREFSDKGPLALFGQALRTPTVRRALFLGCCLQMFQQIAGINTVMYYSAKILSMAGISDDSEAIWISAGVASVNFLCTFVGLFLVERIGRRLLLLGSLSGVVLSLGFLALGFQLSAVQSPSVTVFETGGDSLLCGGFDNCASCTNEKDCGFCFMEVEGELAVNGSCLPIAADSDHLSSFGRCSNLTFAADLTFAPDYCPSSTAWLTVLGLCSYLFFFAPGMGPMPWTINSEIYPLWARSLGNSLSTSTNWAFNLLISMTFLTLTEAITKEGAFYLYMGIALVGLVLFYLILPETKGRSLEEMEQVFAGDWMIKSANCCKKKSNKETSSSSSLPGKKSADDANYAQI